MTALPFAPETRVALVRWIGIAGASFTLFSGLKYAIPLARLLTPPTESWLAGLTALWLGMFAFTVPITRTDATLLSLMVFFVMNSLNAARAARSRTRATGWSFAAVLTLLVALFHEIIISTPDPNERDSLFGTYLLKLGDKLIEPAGHLLPNLDILMFMQFAGVAAFLSILMAGLAIALPIAHRVSGLAFNLAAFTRRLWLILAGFAALILLNGLLRHLDF